jgi:hypothetical protein
MRALIFFLIDTYMRDPPINLRFPTHRSPFPSLGMSGYDHEPKRHTFFLAVILQIRNLSSLSSPSFFGSGGATASRSCCWGRNLRGAAAGVAGGAAAEVAAGEEREKLRRSLRRRRGCRSYARRGRRWRTGKEPRLLLRRSTPR